MVCGIRHFNELPYVDVQDKKTLTVGLLSYGDSFSEIHSLNSFTYGRGRLKPIVW